MAAIKSFPNGSAGGTDCLRPQHIKDLVVSKDVCDNLLISVTGFVNLLLKGHCPPQVQKVIFGGNLIALAKKDGGVRPIAVGSVGAALLPNAQMLLRSNTLSHVFLRFN